MADQADLQYIISELGEIKSMLKTLNGTVRENQIKGAVRDQRLNQLEKSQAELPKRKNDESGNTERIVTLVLTWAWRFMLGGAALVGALNLDKLAGMFK